MRMDWWNSGLMEDWREEIMLPGNGPWQPGNGITDNNILIRLMP